MTIKNPWTTSSIKRIYDNPWILVREDAVVRPDGNPGIYGVVHFKNKAIGVLPVDSDGFIHLVGQYRYPLESYSWEIPEGGCPELENPLEAAKRELQEETGLTADQWTMLGTAHLSNSVSDEQAIWFLATGLTAGRANPEGTEELEHKHVSFEQALNMVLDGKITDSVSVMAIMSLDILLRRHGLESRDASRLNEFLVNSTPGS